MIAVNDITSQADDGIERHATPCGGVMVRLTSQFPRTCIEMLMPIRGHREVATLLDVSGDGVADHRFGTPLVFIDHDENGIIERDTGDALLLRPTEVKVIQDGVALEAGTTERARVVDRIIEQLGGCR